MRDADPTGGAPATGDQHARTRERVARTILENGPSTAARLAEHLGLTPAGIRRHLDTLVDDGVLESQEERVYGQRGRGRPAKVFALTPAGRDAFEQAYDDLAVGALEFLAKTGGDDMVLEFARHRIADLEQRYRPALEAAGTESRVQVLARVLSEDGYAASAQASPVVDGDQLCQHHCPVAHVAERFPQLCEAETEAFARLLGTHVQRIATIAHGEGVCTTHVPRSSEVPGAAPPEVRHESAERNS